MFLYKFWEKIMERVYNFSAGPSMLPIDVLEEVQRDLLNYDNSGMSITEMSHRTKTFDKVIQEAESLLNPKKDVFK